VQHRCAFIERDDVGVRELDLLVSAGPQIGEVDLVFTGARAECLGCCGMGTRAQCRGAAHAAEFVRCLDRTRVVDDVEEGLWIVLGKAPVRRSLKGAADERSSVGHVPASVLDRTDYDYVE